MTSARELAETISTEADKLGVGVTFGYGGKHRFATIDDGRATRRITFSSTPSRDRAVDLVRADVRRTVRDMQLRTPVAPLAPIIPQAAQAKPTFTWLAEPVAEPLPEIARPPEIEIVYHYTTSAALPFILGRKLVHDRHDGNLHATESRNGEKTTTGAYRLANRGNDPYREGAVCRVRFACYASDFEKIDAEPYSAATGSQVRTDNYTRAEPLPLDRVIAIDVRHYLGHCWKPFDINTQIYRLEDRPGYLGVEIDGKLYASHESEMTVGHHTALGYEIVGPLTPEAGAT
jgi:hypothetical protein